MSKPLSILRQMRLAIVLLAALVHGLCYVMLVPPWQHYDEPTHFEYALILAKRPLNGFTFPKEGETDPVARQNIAASMVEHGFYDDLSRPNLLSRDNVNIGVMQINDQPLYYLLVSLPLRLLRYADVTTQLMVGRLMSLLLYLLTIFVAAKATAELVPAPHPLQMAVPLVLALLPSFTDIMTAVNDDVGAVLVVTLFFWAAIRLLKYGFSAWRLAVALLVTLACVYTKSTAMIAVPLLLIVLALLVFRRRQWLVWAALAAILPIALAATLNFGDAQYWYRGQGQLLPTSTLGGGAGDKSPQFPVGERAFQLKVDPSAPAWGVGIRQPIPHAVADQLRGKRVTLGAWMWASAELPANTAIRTPIFYDQNIGLNEHDLVYVSAQPTFYAYSLTVPANLNFASVALAPFFGSATEATVYFDGVVLVEGDFPANTAPQFGDADAARGTWAGKPVVNLLRNASAESRWPMLRPSIDRLATRFIGTQASTTLSSLLDLGSTGWYYRVAFDNIMRSFWATFGWGHVALGSSIGAWLYPLLMALWLLGLLGCGLMLYKRKPRFGDFGSALTLLFGVACVLVWGIAFQRGLEFGLFYWLFVPSARYTFTVILPVVLMLTCGWLTLVRLLAGRSGAAATGFLVGLAALLVSLDIVSLMRIVGFYTGR